VHDSIDVNEYLVKANCGVSCMLKKIKIYPHSHTGARISHILAPPQRAVTPASRRDAGLGAAT